MSGSDAISKQKAHPVLWALTAIGFSGVVTIAAFCAKVGGAEEQLTTVVQTQAKESETLARLTQYEAIDQYRIEELSKRTDKLEDKK